MWTSKIKMHKKSSHSWLKYFFFQSQAYKYITDNYTKDGEQFENPTPKKESGYGNASKFKNEKRQKTKMEEQVY
jgi:hypothetical protein